MNFLHGCYCTITITIQLMKFPIIIVFSVIALSNAEKTDRNLALKKPTEQTKINNRHPFLTEHLDKWHKSSRAVDGDFGSNIHYNGDFCAQPNSGDIPIPWKWWMVDLQSVYTVRSFSFTVRTDADHWYNKYFAVEVSIEDPKTLDGFPARSSASECLVKNTTIPWTIERFTMQCKKPVQGRYVRVVKYPNSGQLVICEFEVFEKAKGVRDAWTDRTNLALNKPTSIDGTTFQTSQSKKGKPEKLSQYFAVDGEGDGYVGASGMCYISRQVDPSASPFISFLVDLEGTYLIDTIFISNCIQNPKNLQNFSVEVSMQVPSNVNGSPNESNLRECFRQIEPVPIGYMVEYKCNQPVAGRYVRLARFIETKSQLCLCELQVYEQPIKSLSSSTDLDLEQDFALIQIWSYAFMRGKGVSGFDLNSVSVHRMLSRCARRRIRMGININIISMVYILTDINSGECHFLDTLEEIENMPVLHWIMYEIEFD